MSKQINIGGRLHSTEQGNVITGANEVLDDTKGKKQNVINADVDAELLRLDQSKQNNLTFDNTPTENSNNPVKSSGVYAADKALSDAIEAILILIPSAATALNQLADKNFVNSSIATDTATFRGTSATGLSETQFLEWANGLTHDMNDYVFWQTIDEAGNTLFKRYKWNGMQWLYEYTLNNSSFTADQWAAIMSGITSALVEKLNGLPTNAALQQALNSKQDALTFDNVPTEGSTNPVKSGGVYSAVKAEEDARLNLSQTVSEIGGDVSQIEDVIPAGATAQNKLVANSSMEAYVASIIQNITASFTLATTDGHINLTLTQVNGQIATLTLTSSDIASAQALTALTGRVTTAEGNITSLTGRVSTNETDIANLQQLYNNLQQSKPVPVTALPETGQQQGVIYRVAGTTSYSDYMWNGSTWVLMATYNNAIDPRPKKASLNLVTSSGVFDNMGALDVSELNATENPHTLAQYADLTAALAAIPTDYQKGGMSIKFVQSSDNKYVQYRLMSASFSTATYDWQNIGEFYPEVNYTCDANYYKWIPCNLPAGEWKITLYNASPTANVTAAFKDANGEQFYYTDEVPPQQTKQFIVELETDAVLVATAFVGSKLVIEKVSYSDKVISALQGILEDQPLYSIIADNADYKSYPCVLEPGKYFIRCTNARTDIPITVSFKNSNNEDIYISEEIPPSATSEFIAELSESSVVMLTAGVGTVVDIFSCSVISYIQDDISELQDDISELQNEGEFTETLITVDINGTIGVDCDYNNIQTALDSITDNTEKNRYVVFVKNGTYDITGISYIGFKNYVTVRGETRDSVIIYNSSVSYSASTVCFDPIKYGNYIIDYARIENLTMKIKNGKCCIHIDGHSIKDGGTIEIDNCRFINETEQQYLYYLRGGINCGLNGGQTVKVTNCFGNVLCYAHTQINPQQVSSPNSFVFENCQFNFIAFYDISDKVMSGLRNKLIVKDCKCDYIGIGVSDAANDKSKCSIDYIIDNNTQFNWVYVFGQGYVDGYDNWFTKYPICSSIHQVVKNDTGSTISKGTFVSLNINGGIPASDNLQPQYDYNIVPYNGNELYGITLEDIPSGDIGIVQISGKVLIPNNNYSVGDYITLNENGVPIVGTKDNAVGVITNPDQPYIGGSLMRLLNRNIVY